MSESTPTTRSSAEASEPAPRRRTWWGWGRRMLVVYVLLPYVGLCLLLALMQRSLIYVPTREKTPLVPEDAGLGPGRVEAVAVTTHDDLVLNGWHVRPEGAEADREPEWLVLYFHGNAGNRRLRVRDCTDFTDVGLDVLLFDYRGYGDNPGRPNESDLARDAATIWRFATGEFGVPSERVLLYGESLGGAVAIRLAKELCDAGTPPAGLFTSSTFSSLPDAASRIYPWLPVRLLLLERYPSTDRIAGVTCPILMVHGDADRIVPFDLGEKLFAAAPDRSTSGVEKRFVPFPGRGHNDLAKSEIATLVEDWLARLRAR